MESPYQYVRELPLREINEIQQSLMEAYLELSYTKSRKNIRVKELCKASYVARSTFYVYYDSMEELLEHIENNIIYRLLKLNDALAYEERTISSMAFYGETLAYLNTHKRWFYSFLVQEPNQSFIKKWKDAIKQHLWERVRHKGLSGQQNEALILEMVAAEAIAGYTFWLAHPYETNEADIKQLLIYTLGMLE